MVALGHAICCGPSRTRRVRPVTLTNPVPPLDEAVDQSDRMDSVSSAVLDIRTVHAPATR